MSNKIKKSMLGMPKLCGWQSNTVLVIGHSMLFSFRSYLVFDLIWFSMLFCSMLFGVRCFLVFDLSWFHLSRNIEFVVNLKTLIFNSDVLRIRWQNIWSDFFLKKRRKKLLFFSLVKKNHNLVNRNIDIVYKKEKRKKEKNSAGSLFLG